MPSFTSSDGARLAYTDTTPETGSTGSTGSTGMPGMPGRTVVLVAGYAMPATGWALQQDALLAAGHRVVAFDRRSHGDSDDVLWGQRVARHGADLHELLLHLDLRDVLYFVLTIVAWLVATVLVIEIRKAD